MWAYTSPLLITLTAVLLTTCTSFWNMVQYCTSGESPATLMDQHLSNSGLIPVQEWYQDLEKHLDKIVPVP